MRQVQGMSSLIQYVRERDDLEADLADVDAMLANMGEHDDPIGYSQFVARRAELEEALRVLGLGISGSLNAPVEKTT
jgi:hypothetical protein